ncbi:MAG: xanthine dehydrogenase family protein molybdopterin-binding subunit [Chloroflexi bacterium]|nr:xanthine dehydrogenase family protein molybdopterin-binding subunit [Chloroflexota bacterium]
MTAEPVSGVGVSRPRPDSEVKVRGVIRYAADRRHPGALHARPVLAIRAHARIIGIDASAALELPGVVAVLLAKDLPFGHDDVNRLVEPLARDEVVFAGQPVALVIATSAVAAEDAAELVDVHLEPLPVVLDPEAAMHPGSPLVRADLTAADDDAGGTTTGAATHAAVGGESDASIDAETLSPNVVERTRYRFGDADTAFREAAATAGGRFRTSWVHQGYLETQACAAWQDEDGTLVVESSTQGTFALRNDVSKALGIPVSAVRIVAPPLGGAFGGKWSLFEPLVAAAAMRLGRPVRFVLDRRDDFLASNPSEAFTIDVEVAAAADGTLTALRGRLVVDAGAFSDYTAGSLGATLLGGPYRWPAVDVSAYGVVTNRVGVGTYRAPSGPPTAFALESALDELAATLGLDPIDLRRRNAAKPGDRMVDEGTWAALGTAEVLDALASDPLWAGRGGIGPDEGVGLAIGFWPGSKAPAAALCRISADGTIQVVTGVVDMSGTAGGFQAIAAEVLGVGPGAIQVVSVDTASAPASPGSGGSAITYGAGRAVRAAAEAVRERLLIAAALELEIDVADLEIVNGVVRPIGTPDRGIAIARLVRANNRAGRAPIEAHASTEHTSLAPSVAGFVAHVRVDRETGRVRLLDVRAVQDVGRALNPALVGGQQLGGAAQAAGWALLEALRHDEAGQLLSATFLDYALPRAEDVPSLRASFVEVPAPDGPFGAKGIGEAAVVGGPAAIANAVAAAIGRRPRELPMTAPRIWRLLRDA